MVKEEFKLNQPQASDGWLTQDALWLVSKTVSDKLRAHLLSQGIEGIPASNTAVFDVLQDHGIALATSEGKAIWKATVTSDSNWSHSFTFLKLPPALIWDAADRPAPFAGTVRIEDELASRASEAAPEMVDAGANPVSADGSMDALGALLDVLETKPIVAPVAPTPENNSQADEEDESEHPAPVAPSAEVTPAAPAEVAGAEPPGAHFLNWLRHGVQSRKIIINDAKALVHTVAGTVYLVSPGVFQRYAQEHLHVAQMAKQAQLSEWQWVQQGFERMKVHKKRSNGLNIWPCEVSGPRKSRRLHGYLLADPRTLFDETQPDNPYLKLIEANQSEL